MAENPEQYVLLLQKKRLECDSLADDAVKAVVLNRGESFLKSTDLYRTIKELGTELKDPSCARFVEFYENEPPWDVKWGKCEIGKRLFVRNSGVAGLVLMYSSLVLSFTYALGNKVLMAMSCLTAYRNVRLRLFETLHFVKEVVLGSASDIKAECMKVRLLHAAIRYHLWHCGIHWEVEKYGQPINQEDLAGTLSKFTCVVINGLDILGVSTTEEERDGYQHLWKYVGHYLGISSDLLCNNFQEESLLASLITVRQSKPDKDSVMLADSLIQAFSSKPPFHLSYDTSSKLSRYLIDDKDIANKLNLKEFGVLGQLVMAMLFALLRFLTFLQRRISPLEQQMYCFGKYCITRLLELTLKGQRPSYVMKV